MDLNILNIEVKKSNIYSKHDRNMFYLNLILNEKKNVDQRKIIIYFNYLHVIPFFHKKSMEQVYLYKK